MPKNEQLYARIIAGLLSTILSCYCFVVLAYIATSADIGVKCILSNDVFESKGLQIREVPGSDESEGDGFPIAFGTAPVPGDRLLQLGDHKVESFKDFTFAMAQLRSVWRKELPYDSRVSGNSYPINRKVYLDLPSVIDYNLDQENQVKEASRKYVRIKYYQEATGEEVYCWLVIKPLSSVSVVLAIIWCLLQFALLLVAALSFCNRPSDHAARLFFALSLFTLPAFVGGYYWWIVSESLLLTLPFFYCAIFLPAITLHFFLNYPTRHLGDEGGNLSKLVGIYLIPSLMTMLVTILLGIAHFSGADPVSVKLVRLALGWIRVSVDVYIILSCLYFTVSVYFVVKNYRSCTQPAEQNQLKWIVIASSLALPLVLYTGYLTFGDRIGLALGKGRIPMVIVSLLFMTAYAIGIIRHRLMLLDQIISQHTIYLLLSQAVTVAYSLVIAVGSVLTVYRGIAVPDHLLPLSFMLTVAILALGWIRSLTQEAIDRRFFRDKNRLDRAMHQMNTVVAKVADVRSLAEHMLRSCREVLQVRSSALYLRDGHSHHYNLIASVGGKNLPGSFQLDDESEKLLQQGGSFQRVPSSSKQNASRLQELHRELNSQLMHGFEVDGELSGIVLLGKKSSSSLFTSEDTTFVNAIGQMTGVALQCVRVQQNVSRLDGMLQEKVRKIESQERQIAILNRQVSANVIEAAPVTANVVSEPPEFDQGNICGTSPAIKQVIASAKKVARSDSSVLIRGESGTGKELLARAIHLNSDRGGAPLVGVNCAALSASLLESELFGHVKGAFTGAYQDVQGRFQMADHGTLFLDEIGDVSPEVQVKLLRVLQERQFEPVGSRESVSVDVRLIAATHQNLEELIRNGKFREDLYYRLNVITLQLPPLRERKEDIFDLSLEFLNEATSKTGKKIKDIDDLAFRALLNYHWPGNIRELHNAIHRAVILAETDCLLLENLPLEVQQSGTDSITTALNASESKPMKTARIFSRPEAKKEFQTTTPVGAETEGGEAALLIEALQASQGNKAKAARMLGMPRSTFYSKLNKHGIELK